MHQIVPQHFFIRNMHLMLFALELGFMGLRLPISLRENFHLIEKSLTLETELALCETVWKRESD